MQHKALLRSVVVASLLILVVAVTAGGTAVSVSPAAVGSLSEVTADRTVNTSVAQTDPAGSDSAPDDPEEDVLGWENGYWYNESLDITPDNGYTKSELDKILARSMARVEQIRGLEFDETPNLNVLPRQEYANYTSRQLDEAVNQNVTTKDRLHQNTKFEALFVVPEAESYFDDRVGNQADGGSAAAFYTSSGIPELGVAAGEIAIIVDGGEQAGRFNEFTLGHELVHRLQDTNLGTLDTFRGGPTEEASTLNTSLVEADATFVGQNYRDRCNGEWDCAPPPESGPSSILDFENPGLVLYGLGPYSETAELFRTANNRGGVEAMNALYDQPPVSTEQLLHPERYPDDRPAEIDYTDTSTEEWSTQTFENGVNYASFGEVGLFMLLYYPSLDTRSAVVMGPNFPFQGVDTPSRFDFTHPASTGWNGDKMFVYTNESSAETGETAYVWETRWDSPDDAQEFVDAYTTVLDEYAGSGVDGAEDTYLLSDGSPYSDAFHIDSSGETVTIVNAPTVDDLSDVYDEAPDAPSPDDTDGSDDTGSNPDDGSDGTGSNSTDGGDDTGSNPDDGGDVDDTSDPTGSDGSGSSGDGSDEPSDTDQTTEGDGSGPGFTLFAGVLAVVLTALLARRRRE